MGPWSYKHSLLIHGIKFENFAEFIFECVPGNFKALVS